MMETKLDQWIKNHYLLDHLIQCNSLPDYMPQRGYVVQEEPNINSKWSRTIVCSSPELFFQITALMNMQHIPHASQMTERKSVMAYMLKPKHGESLTWGFIWGGIRWIFLTILTILSPLYLIKVGVWEIGRQIKNFIYLLAK